MKEATLIFPTNDVVADFVLENRVSGIQTDSKAFSVNGLLSDDVIATACAKYDAVLVLKPLVSWG